MMTRFSAVAAITATAALIAQASASGDTAVEEGVYVGCYHDNKDDRVLGDTFDDPDMTPTKCLEYCTELGAAYMATQWGFECWCSPDGGLDYNRHYEIHGEDAVCNMSCMGDESETCGGYDTFSLYKLQPLMVDGCLRETPVMPYEQCGGSSWTGLTCCTDGHECVAMGSGGCYSQCRPASSDSTTPAPVTTEETTPPVATEEPTPATPAPVTEETTTPPVATEPPVATAEPTPAPVTPEPTPAPVTPEPTPAPVAVPATSKPVAPAPADECAIVLIEAEDLPISGAWKVVNDAAASGNQYITWEGLAEEQNNFSPDDGDIISYSFEITVPGEYSFTWLMRQPSGVESDKGNDSWLYFPDASRFGPKNTSRNYGTFVKVFGNAPGQTFEYSGTAEEANHDQTAIALEFGAAGTYRIEISGRSHGHEIDQILMYGQGVSLENAAKGC